MGNALWDLHIECAEMEVKVKVKVKRGRSGAKGGAKGGVDYIGSI